MKINLIETVYNVLKTLSTDVFFPDSRSFDADIWLLLLYGRVCALKPYHIVSTLSNMSYVLHTMMREQSRKSGKVEHVIQSLMAINLYEAYNYNQCRYKVTRKYWMKAKLSNKFKIQNNLSSI